MLLLFNKTTKPLNQFAKKKKKKKVQKSVLGATADDLFYIFDNIFPHFFIFFFCYTVFKNPSFIQNIRKRNKRFWIYSRGNRHK